MLNESGHGKPLLLIPTPREHDLVADHLPDQCDVRPCGFGPIASGIETARWLGEGGFGRVILLGIAGTFDESRWPVGQAFCFRRVACYGVGAGAGDALRTPRELGLAQTVIDGVERFDELPLETAAADSPDLLLTVASSSGSGEEVRQRLQKFPAATAEDMEGFAVALAAARFGLSTTIIRGISNVAGDRNHARWRIPQALTAAVDVLAEVLRGNPSP